MPRSQILVQYCDWVFDGMGKKRKGSNICSVFLLTTLLCCEQCKYVVWLLTCDPTHSSVKQFGFNAWSDRHRDAEGTNHVFYFFIFFRIMRWQTSERFWRFCRIQVSYLKVFYFCQCSVLSFLWSIRALCWFISAVCNSSYDKRTFEKKKVRHFGEIHSFVFSTEVGCQRFIQHSCLYAKFEATS